MSGAWVSIDFEARGDIPGVPGNTIIGLTGPAVMLGLAVIPKSYNICSICNDTLIETYTAEKKEWCIEEYCVPSNSPGQLKFWNDNAELLHYIRDNAMPLATFLQEFHEFYESLLDKYGSVEFIAKPAAYDWMWLSTLYNGYYPTPHPNFTFKATCISSQWSLLELALSPYKVRSMNKIITACPLNNGKHRALEDAIYQAFMFLVIRRFALENMHTRL